MEDRELEIAFPCVGGVRDGPKRHLRPTSPSSDGVRWSFVLSQLRHFPVLFPRNSAVVLEYLFQLIDKHLESGADIIEVDQVLQWSKTQENESLTLSELVKVADQSDDLEIFVAYEANASVSKLHLWDRRHLNRMMEKKETRGTPVLPAMLLTSTFAHPQPHS